MEDTVLRVLCAPNERTRGTGYHKHACLCGATWKHKDADMDETTKKEHELAHTCPECGDHNFFTYLKM